MDHTGGRFLWPGQVSVSRRQEQAEETRCLRHDRNPVYEEGFSLVSHPELDDLNLKVYDERYRATLGLLRLNLANLVNRGGMEYLNQPFKLKNTNGCESSVILSLQLFFSKESFPRRLGTWIDFKERKRCR